MAVNAFVVQMKNNQDDDSWVDVDEMSFEYLTDEYGNAEDLEVSRSAKFAAEAVASYFQKASGIPHFVEFRTEVR